MNFSILISLLLICYILFINGTIELTWTKADCDACCETCQGYIERIDCFFSCTRKFSNRTQSFSTKYHCLRSCRVIIPLCREGCIASCNQIFRRRGWRSRVSAQLSSMHPARVNSPAGIQTTTGPTVDDFNLQQFDGILDSD